MDSGLRHSVGGQDYGTVRASAFMGLKIMSVAAQEIELRSQQEDLPASEAPQAQELDPIGEFLDTKPRSIVREKAALCLAGITGQRRGVHPSSAPS